MSSTFQIPTAMKSIARNSGKLCAVMRCAQAKICAFSIWLWTQGLIERSRWNQAGATQASLDDIIKKVCAIRLSFLQELGTWRYFGAGWTRRVAACRSAALKISSSGTSQMQPTAAAAGTIGTILMGTAAAIHYLQTEPYGPVLALIIVATILLVLCLFLSKPSIAPAIQVLSPAEKLKNLLAQREAIIAHIAETETELKASIDEMASLLGKIHPQGETKS
jgi:hypothetical protein